MAALFGLVLALGSAGAFANEDQEAGDGKSPEYREAADAVKKQDYAKAIPLLKALAGQNGKDADVYNLLGFSQRKLGDFDRAFANYRTALELNPKHRGAHEYIGEAYLKKGKLAKAREHLKKLDDLCFWGCEEYTDLKKAVEKFEARR